MYFFPLNAATEAALQDKWQEATAGEQPALIANTQIEVMFNRTLQVGFSHDVCILRQRHGHKLIGTRKALC